MNAVSPACELELLSAYLDEELAGDEVARVEAHLETCHSCRSRLEGLTRVSETLRSLERAAPPPILEELVLGRREVPGARSWSGRLAQMNEASRRTRSTIGLVFAMVLMLVVFVYLFSLAQSRQARTSTVISVTADHLRGPAGTQRDLVRVVAEDVGDQGMLEDWMQTVGVEQVWRSENLPLAALVDLDSVVCTEAGAAGRGAVPAAPSSARLAAVLRVEGGEIRCALRPAEAAQLP